MTRYNVDLSFFAVIKTWRVILRTKHKTEKSLQSGPTEIQQSRLSSQRKGELGGQLRL